jgi:hypothetical protein
LVKDKAYKDKVQHDLDGTVVSSEFLIMWTKSLQTGPIGNPDRSSHKRRQRRCLFLELKQLI